MTGESHPYVDFDLHIESVGRRYRARATTPSGGVATVEFSKPFTKDQVKLLVLSLGRSRQISRATPGRVPFEEIQSVGEFGKRLFDKVFRDDVRSALDASLAAARQNRTGLRIRLRLGDVPELADLPWEYLSIPSGDFLALSRFTPIVRYMDLSDAVSGLQVDGPLRMLVMVSNPTNSPVLDVEEEWRLLREGLDGVVKAGQLTIDRLETASLSALRKRLEANTYHIFHFIGHGGFSTAGNAGLLLLEDESDAPVTATGQDLAVFLRDLPALRLAVLNSCEGSRAATTDPFSGTAQTLVRGAGLPAVIAMQFEISDTAAIDFARGFYSALGAGFPVDAAVAEGRKEILANGNRLEWGTPSLFMRTPEGQIFEVAPGERAIAPTPTPAPIPAGDVVVGAIVPPVDDGPERIPDLATPAGEPPAVPPVVVAPAAGASPPEGEPRVVSTATGPAGTPAMVEQPSNAPRGKEPPGKEPPAEPLAGSPSGQPPVNPPPPGFVGGGPPIQPVPPPHIGPGRTFRSTRVAAIAIIAVLGGVLLIGGGRLLLDRPSASTGPGGFVPGPSPTATATPTPTTKPTPTGSTEASEGPVTPTPTVAPIQIAIDVINKKAGNSIGIINGVRLAVKDHGGVVNGVPVTVPDAVVFDDASDPERATSVMSKIIAKPNVIAMVGPYSSVAAIAQIPLSNEAGLLQCSPTATSERLTKPEAGAEKLRQSNPDRINFVRTVTTNDNDYLGAARFLLGRGAKSAYVLDTGVSTSIARAKQFITYWTSQGANFVGQGSLPAGTTDFTAVAFDLKNTGADVVYFSASAGSSARAAGFLKSMAEVGLAVPFLGSSELFDGITTKSGSFLNLAAGVAGPDVYMSFPAAGDYEGRAAFEKRYQDAYGGKSPGLYGITGYVCAQAILNAMSRTDLSMDRNALRDAVRASVVEPGITYSSAMGLFQFDPNGDTTLRLITIYRAVPGADDWVPFTYVDVPAP